MNSNIKIVISFLFLVPSLFFSQECKLINEKKIGETLLDSVFHYPNKQMELVANEFRKHSNNTDYQFLYYRNTGEENLTYFEVRNDSTKIINSNGFNVIINNYNRNKIEIDKNLDKMSLDSKVYEQSCPKDYFLIGGQIIEQIWIKKNEKLSFVYFGTKDPIMQMKDENNIRELKNLLKIIFYKWDDEWGYR